jgi:hypothetical protein
MAEFRYETIQVSLPAGTPAGTHQVDQALDTAYEKAVGVTAYVDKDGGIETFQIGVRDDTNTYVSLANRRHLEAGIECPKPLRATPISIPNKSQKVSVLVALTEPLVSALSMDMVFTLERPNRA